MALVPLRDGEKLSVRCIGRGAPVVLLHGFGSRSSHWLPNVLPLAHKYRFILPDMRGFGHSHHVPFNSEDVFTNYAQDLEDLLDYLELDQVTLGGISTGAYACLAFNQIGGFRRVRKYLNIEHSAQSRNCPEWSHGLFGPRQEEVFAGYRALMEEAYAAGIDTPYWELPVALREKMRDTVASLFHSATHRPLIQRLILLVARYGERFLTRHMIAVERWQVYFQVMRAFMDGKDTRAQLADIRVPMTLMIGMRSQYFSSEGQMDICRYVPHAKVVRFENSGHIPIVDEPLKFQREFSAFLRNE